jgi:hypothetical protein
MQWSEKRVARLDHSCQVQRTPLGQPAKPPRSPLGLNGAGPMLSENSSAERIVLIMRAEEPL